MNRGGADVNAVNKVSQTPLLYACSERHLEMGKLHTLKIFLTASWKTFFISFFLSVRTLIELKADIGLANKLHWDWTPIHTAVMADAPDIVDTLVKAGADREAKDGAGRDAETLAEEYRKERVMEYFRKGEAKGKK